MPDPERELRYVMDAVRLVRRELARPRAADRLRGQPVDGRDLHGRGRQQQDVRAHQGHAVRRAARAAPAARRCSRTPPATTSTRRSRRAHRPSCSSIPGAASLRPPTYREFSLRYMQPIVEGLTREREGRRVPVILFTKGGGAWLGDMAATRLRRAGRRLDDGSRRRAPGRAATASRCRATSIRARCTRRRRDPRARRAACSRASGRVTGTSSTSATAYIPTCRPSTRWRWSRPCTSCRRRITPEAGRDHGHQQDRIGEAPPRDVNEAGLDDLRPAAPGTAPVHRAAPGAGSCRRWSSAARRGSTPASAPCSR